MHSCRPLNLPAALMGLAGMCASTVLLAAPVVTNIAPRPTGRVPGRMTIKLAVLNYEPRFAAKSNQTYWQWGKWKDPRVCVQMLANGWRDMSDGMLDIQVAHWTNVNQFPYSMDTNRFGHHRYTEETFTADFRKNYIGMAHYLTCLTADFPHLLAMVGRGEVVWWRAFFWLLGDAHDRQGT